MPILSFSIWNKLDENLYDNSMCMRIVFEIAWKCRLYALDILLDSMPILSLPLSEINLKKIFTMSLCVCVLNQNIVKVSAIFTWYTTWYVCRVFLSLIWNKLEKNVQILRLAIYLFFIDAVSLLFSSMKENFKRQQIKAGQIIITC